MKEDTAFLLHSQYAKHFNFSPKSDPFLVFPSTKHQGVGGLRKLQNLKKDQKMVIPLPNSLMKMVRQSEAYMMEEAVTDSIMKKQQ